MSNESLQGKRWIGRVLRDRWRIDARISRGGVGTVYAATHKNNGSRAAIKVLHPEFSRDADTRSRFLQEGYAANQVNHPGVVRILDDDTTDEGYAYLVMELLEGELLETRRVRKGGTLPLPDVFEVGEQLLDVLAAAHDKGIVHRDIKPDNLFITHEGRLKVLDFGFAQMRSQFRPDVTATGFLLGTPGFMSPEQAVGNRAQVDAQTDVWATGATLFTLLSGEPVHDGQSAAEMLVAAANFQPRSLAAVTNGIAVRLVEIVDRAIAFDKADRWPNARSMQLALRGLAGRQQVGAVSRRSIPDVEPVSDGPTLFEDPMFIEELDASELVDSASAQARIAADHGADYDDATLAVPPATKAPQTPQMAGRPSLEPPSRPSGPPRPTPRPVAPNTPPPVQISIAPERPLQRPPTPAPMTAQMPAQIPNGRDGVMSSTLIMESPLASPKGKQQITVDMTPPKTEPTPFGQRAPSLAPSQGSLPVPPQQSVPPRQPSLAPQMPRYATPQHLTPTDAALRSNADELLFRPPPKKPPQSGTSRALLFVGITIVTMIVVIMAGLLFLHYGD